jgi:large subunit ribosomal protein L18
MNIHKKKELSQKRRWRIRKKVVGTAMRPRLTVRFTHKHIHAQCIDDGAMITKIGLSTNSSALKDKGLHSNIAGAEVLGKIVGEQAKAAGIEYVVFDRAGARYHGRVKAFADAARQAGLNF